MRWRLETDVRTKCTTGNGVLTSVIVGCEDGVVLPLVGEVGQKLVAGTSGIDGTDCSSEAGEACVVQSLHEARDVGSILSTSQAGCESQDRSRENENHVLYVGSGEEGGLRRYLEEPSWLALL